MDNLERDMRRMMWSLAIIGFLGGAGLVGAIMWVAWRIWG